MAGSEVDSLGLALRDTKIRDDGEIFDALDMDDNPNSYCDHCKKMLAIPGLTSNSSLWTGEGRRRGWFTRLEWSHGCLLCERLLDLVGAGGEGGLAEGHLQFYTLDGEDDHDTLPKWHQAKTFDDENIFATAREQLAACRASHKSCGQSSGDPPLPTRVIDVGEDESVAPRLHITASGAFSAAPYACLSYSWGAKKDGYKGAQLMTLAKNLDSFTQELPVGELSQTVQDAITVTRRLELRYLWVDALCIVQGPDNKDKAAEIDRMGDIYKNSTVTIAAGSSPAAELGFLRYQAKQPPSLAMRVRMPAAGGHLIKVPRSVPRAPWKRNERDKRPRVGKIYITPYSSFTPQGRVWKQENPLETRGWVMQEFILSPRMLIFNSTDVVWRCQSGTQDKGLIPGARVGSPSIPKAQRMPLGSFGSSWMSLTDVVTNITSDETQLDIWQRMVQDFTRRGLTSMADRIPAMAGITGELRRVWRDECSFGVWQAQGPSGLAWTAAGDAAKGRLRGAPTWSWASVDVPVNYLRVDKSDCSFVSLPQQSSTKELLHNEDQKGVGLTILAQVIPPEKIPKVEDGDSGNAQDWYRDVEKGHGLDHDWHLMLVGRTEYHYAPLKKEWICLALRKVGENTYEKWGVVTHKSGENTYKDLKWAVATLKTADSRFAGSNSPFADVLKTCLAQEIRLV